MNPILFAENATNFTTNGLGRLSDTIECIVTEERNGIFELEMVYPMYGQHYSEIGIRSIIVAKPAANANLQAFRVYKMDKPIGGRVKIYAQHISYDLSKNTVMPFEVTASASACINTLGGLYTNAVESCPFYFTTDVTTVASYTQKTPASIKSRLGGVRGSVLDQFGGEYEWDNYTVKLWRNRGIVTNITLRYGKNIIDLEQEENIANTVTGVVPFWSNIDGDEVVTLSEKVVRSSHASQYSEYLTVPLDLSQEWDEAPTEEQLRTAATVYVNKQGFGIPKVSTTVSFVNLAETEEYKDLLPLQNVNLCDTITVQFEKLGISTTAKIVKTVFNVLKERYDELQIGSLKSNLASTITDAEAATVQAISDSGQRVFAEANTEAQDLVNNATAWLTSSGGYVIAIKNNDGTWKELLFMDTNDVTTAHNVLRVNENGIGFSSTGVGGPFTQAWTLDGKLVIGGTNVPSLTVYKADGQTILFQVDKDKIIWDVPNSSMDAHGNITAKDMVLTGGQLTLGGVNHYGQISMYGNDNVLNGTWSKSNFVIYDGDGTLSDNILFQANSDGALVRGELDLKISSDNRVRIMKYGGNAVIFFDGENGDAYIDGTGSGTDGGINMNAERVVFSVDDIGVTSSRGSTVLRNAWSGSILCNDGIIRDVVNGLIVE